MELSEEKLHILQAPEDKVVVMSAAGSGKTTLLTEKVRQVLRSGSDPRKMAVITFTNMAATTLRERLGDDYRDGIFIGTIHSLANYFLLSSGIKTNKILDDEEFDKLFELVEENPFCIKQLDWIFLDEAQDSDDLQFRFLFGMIDPPHFFVIGDIRQAIYGFKGGNPNLMMSLIKNGVGYYQLTENFRCGRNILDFARGLVSRAGMSDLSRSMRRTNGALAEFEFNLDLWVSKIKSIPPYSSWAILVRTNNELDSIVTALKRKEIPCETFKQGDLTKDQLEEIMQHNSVKVLTVHSAKGLEWDNVIVSTMRYGSKEELRLCYVAATRARDLLIWTRPKAARKRTNKLNIVKW